MGRTRHRATSQNCLELATCFQSLQFDAAPERLVSSKLFKLSELDGQTLAAFSATCVDHSTSAASFHANKKTVSAGAFDLGRLVSAFHFENPKGLYDGPLLLRISEPLRLTPQPSQGNL